MSIVNEGGPILETDFPPGYSPNEDLLKGQQEQPHGVTESDSSAEITSDKDLADAILKRFESAPDAETREAWGKVLDYLMDELPDD